MEAIAAATATIAQTSVEAATITQAVEWHLMSCRNSRSNCKNCWIGVFIRPSTSPWGTPVLFGKNKDKTLQLCINY